VLGEGNGAPTLDALRARIGDLRERNELRGAGGPPQIGCIVLVQAVFFPPEQWVRQPADWAARNLRYTRYDLIRGEGARIWGECQERAASLVPTQVESAPMAASGASRYGAQVLVRPRLGQGAFRVAVTDAYGRSCAVTREHSLPVLEAREVSRGLLSRPEVGAIRPCCLQKLPSLPRTMPALWRAPYGEGSHLPARASLARS
jgi:putative restriction endonuclease